MPLLFLPDALNARIMPTAPNIPVLCLYDAQYVCTVHVLPHYAWQYSTSIERIIHA